MIIELKLKIPNLTPRKMSTLRKPDCVIDHITDNRLDIVGITETWLSNYEKNNMSVVNTCLDSGYSLYIITPEILVEGG